MDTEEVHIVDPTLDSMAMGSTSRLHLLHSTAGHRRTQITRMRGIQSTMIVRWGMEDTQEQDKDQEADIEKRDALDRGRWVDERIQTAQSTGGTKLMDDRTSRTFVAP